MVLGVVLLSLLVNPQSVDPKEPEITLDQKLQLVFGDKAPLMKAIAKAESGLDEKQVSYNCLINGKNKPCRNKNLAWSSDCGTFQINVKGKECPAHLLTLDGNLHEAKKKLDSEGLKAWVAYKNGRYKRFL